MRWPYTVYLFIIRFQFLQKIHTFSFVYEHKAWACQPLGGSFYLVAQLRTFLFECHFFKHHPQMISKRFLFMFDWMSMIFFKGKNLETCCLFKPMLFPVLFYCDPTSPFSVVNMYKVNSKRITEAPLWTLESIKTLHLLCFLHFVTQMFTPLNTNVSTVMVFLTTYLKTGWGLFCFEFENQCIDVSGFFFMTKVPALAYFSM